ncbi:MAG: hypothetical protein JO199_11630 [Candidatus Eremiobacteraeota bacterium]|nr:hypothetical protein [Candidatus Eremiobacteraeota bacterium]
MSTNILSVLMCPPDYFTVRDVKNPFMRGAEPVDAALAARQWQGLRRAFERAGAVTASIDPVKDLEDMVFAANQCFAGTGARHRRFVVPSRMRFASREREVPYYVAWFSARGYDVVDLALDGDEYFEGHGDALWHPGSARVWAGFGFRSTPGAIARLAGALDLEAVETISLELIDETFYHLDTCFAPLNEGAALYYPGAFAPDALRSLQGGWSRLHAVSREDAARFACNGVALGGTYVASHLSANLQAILRDEGLQPVVVDLSEFEKAGGSAFCLKTFFD